LSLINLTYFLYDGESSGDALSPPCDFIDARFAVADIFVRIPTCATGAILARLDEY